MRETTGHSQVEDSQAEDGQAEVIEDGRYIYAVVKGGAEFGFEFDLEFGKIGIEESEVYLIPCREIAAVVHTGLAEAYATGDDEKAKEWVLEHSYVIDRATKAFGTVLPFSFDVIVRGDDEVVRGWLSDNYDHLKEELERVQNESEYSVQIFCEEERLKEEILGANPKLVELEERIEKMPKGTAYLYQKKLDMKVKKEISIEISRLAEEFGSKIRELADETKIDKKVSWVPEKYEDKRLVVALSCLVHDDRIEELGNRLDEINNREGFAVRFTGPWPPFSFVRFKEARR